MTNSPKSKKLLFAVLAVDAVVFRLNEDQLEVLLVFVARDLYKNKKAHPGGLVMPDETAEQATERLLKDKGGLQGVYLEQLYTFSRVDRDPRGRVVSVAHLALVPSDYVPQKQIETEAEWVPINKLPKLGYDHDEITEVARERLRARVGYTTIIKNLLPREFTLTELQQAYEIVLGHTLDKRNFRKKILCLNLVESTGEKRTIGASRPAELYRFIHKSIQSIEIL